MGLLLAVGLVSTASAQRPERPVFVEVRAGAAVPTFDIEDAAEVGLVVGGTVGYKVTEAVWVFGEGDFGFHGGKDGGPDVNVFHYVGKVGYNLLAADRQWSVVPNLGVGAMTFDVDAPGASANTYIAINAGAKIIYQATPQVGIVLNLQGDIALSDEDEIGTDNAWVWPFTAGVNFAF
jgi:hypothetical protein